MFGPENAPFWFGFALGFAAAAVLFFAAFLLRSAPPAARDPYGEPWQ